MGDEQKTNEEQEDSQVASLDELEKSWNDSRANVLELLGEEVQKSESKDDDTEDLEKAKKKGKDEDMDYDEEDEDDDDDDKEEMKSFQDDMESDLESAQAMDVEPFLRQLVKSMSSHFKSVQKSISKVTGRMDTVEGLQKATAKMFAAYGELQKATAETVEKIGNQSVKSSSVLRKSGDRFETVGDGDKSELDMTHEQILTKALRLRELGKLSVRDVTKIENRLNKSIGLPEDIVKVLKTTIKEDE